MFNKIIRTIKKNGSAILSVIGAIGTITTAYFSGRGMYRTLTLISNKEKKEKKELTKNEKIRIAIPNFLPAGGCVIATLTCILGVNILNKKQQEALSSAYLLVSSSFAQYRSKVKQLNGEDADLEIKNSIASEKFPDEKIQENKVLFYDQLSQRYFQSTMLEVVSAVYHYNRNFQLRGEACVNEFYDFLGIDRLKWGDTLGFNANQMLEDGLTPWIDIITQRAVNCDGTEYYIISFEWDPIPNYDCWDMYAYDYNLIKEKDNDSN